MSATKTRTQIFTATGCMRSILGESKQQAFWRGGGGGSHSIWGGGHIVHPQKIWGGHIVHPQKTWGRGSHWSTPYENLFVELSVCEHTDVL